MFEARICGTGSYLPIQVVDNAALYQKISGFEVAKSREAFAKRGEPSEGLADHEIFDRWVRQVSGIRERHYFTQADVDAFPKKELASPRHHCEIMACQASEQALSDARVDRARIDTVVFATMTSDQLIPNPGAVLSMLLGLGEVMTLTTNTACNGFIDALGVAYARIRAGLSTCALVVASEQYSGRLNYADPKTAILFGDGAGACVLERSETPGLRAYWAGSRYSTNISMGYNEPIVMGGGPLVQKNAVQVLSTAALKALEQAGLTLDQVDVIIPHQANLRILLELARKLGVPAEKVAMPIDRMANISCATVPAALDWYRRGKLEGHSPRPGATVLATSVGGGYAYSGCVLTL